MTAGARRAVFLDRDGVLNEVVMRNGAPESPRMREELRLAPDLHAAGRLKEAGWLVFLITNQPDIARGRITMELLNEFHARIAGDIAFDDVRVCPHEDADACACRKPKPGMILDLARAWGVERAQSYVIGDTWRDVEAARAAGCRSILLRRDYNRDATPDAEAQTLTEAVELVLNHAG